jgi:ATP-dependent Clp protease ATP-binding subunit ClpA
MKSIEESMESQEEIDYEALAELKANLLRADEEINKLEKIVDGIYVTENDVAKVIELWTGIPANKIKQSEFIKIQNLETNLKKHIVGQDEPIELLSKAIKRTRVHLSEKRRPASFIFVGPTGVGKTEFVKRLASELFDSMEPLIKLDMTEYMEKHSVSKMIGSPPGYVGYDDAGQLTEKVRRKPYSVILFDEIEKAHPDVMNILLQILDEGKIEDSKGRIINFENTIICMTSNAGSSDKSSGVGFNKSATEITKERAMKGLKEFLRPEFLGRIDEIVVFNELTEDNFVSISKLMLEEIVTTLAMKGIKLEYTPDVLEVIAKKSYGKSSGARDIRRIMRDEVEDKIASLIIDNMDQISEISMTVENDSVKVENITENN